MYTFGLGPGGIPARPAIDCMSVSVEPKYCMNAPLARSEAMLPREEAKAVVSWIGQPEFH
jgi:hypothetical protein